MAKDNAHSLHCLIGNCIFCRTLTWEDAYYDNREEHYALDNTAFPETGGNLWDLHSHDPLGSAVVKMSCQVYSVGEGYEILFIFDFLIVIWLELYMSWHNS